MPEAALNKELGNGLQGDAKSQKGAYFIFFSSVFSHLLCLCFFCPLAHFWGVFQHDGWKTNDVAHGFNHSHCITVISRRCSKGSRFAYRNESQPRLPPQDESEDSDRPPTPTSARTTRSKTPKTPRTPITPHSPPSALKQASPSSSSKNLHPEAAMQQMVECR